MDVILCNLLVNITASIIYDILKRYGNFRFIRKTDPKEIDNYVREQIKLTFTFVDDPESLLYFLQSPQVTDVIRSYVLFKATGELSEDLKTRFSNNYLVQSDVVEYLAKGYIASKSNSVMLTPAVFIERFIDNLIEIIKGYYINRMSEQDIGTVFLINDHNDQSIIRVSAIMERIVEQVVRSLKYDIIHPSIDTSSIKNKYYSIMIEKFSRAHVYMFDYFDFNKFYVPPRLYREGNGGSEIFYNLMNQTEEIWKHIFDDDRIVYVVGGAGFGKSLFLKNIALNLNDLCLLGQEERLVILGDLKNFIDHQGNIKPVMQFLRESMTAASGMNYSEFPDEFIQHYLDSGLCIILLDALDEVIEDKRNEVHLTVRSFLSFHNPNNKICITSRDRGFIRMNEDCLVYYIRPLTHTQIEKYIDNIIGLGKFDPSDKLDFMSRTNPLIEKGFLSSCLILSLLVRIYRSERALPDNKLELYHKCFSYISFNREINEKKSLDYNWDRISPLMSEDTFTRLAQLCAPNNSEVNSSLVKDALLEANTKTFESQATLINAVNEFLRFCANRTELFVLGANEDTYKFFHRSFLDYFYALYIYKYVSTPEDIYSELSKFGFDSEVFELLLSLLKNNKRVIYNSLIEYVITISKNDLDKDIPTFTPLNILIAFMKEITEKYYDSEFLKIIMLYSKKISKNVKKVESEKDQSRGFNDSKIIQIVLKRNCESETKIVDQFLELYKAGTMQEVIICTKELMKSPKSSSLPGTNLWRWAHIVADYSSFFTLIYIRFIGNENFFNLLENEDFLKTAKVTKKMRQTIDWLSQQYKLADKIDRARLIRILGCN